MVVLVLFTKLAPFLSVSEPPVIFLNHFWSLGVEEQFYLVGLFIIFGYVSRKKLLVFILFLLFFLLIARSVVWMYHFLISTTPLSTHLQGLMASVLVVLIALVHKINYNFLRHKMAIVVTILAILNFGFYFLTQYGDYPYLAFVGFTTFAGMFGLLLHEAVSGDTKIITAILTFPVLKFFGTISYGFYVFHWPVYLMTAWWLSRFFSKNLNSSGRSEQVCDVVVCNVIAILISTVSYYTFEIHFLRLKHKFE
jgi:peptidoglycan/LPS O-acetylase OafA/YrhL